MKKKILVFLIAILVSCSGSVFAAANDKSDKNEKNDKEVTSMGLISIDFQGTTLYGAQCSQHENRYETYYRYDII
jgi:isoaspartyl peptidase/L-asparaginase-like protein (Ntn-hydrolase superfamily)